MAKRKTINVTALIDMVNGICANSAADAVAVRKGAMSVLEQVLFDTRNYAGFKYLMSVKDGAPGVNYKDGKLCEGEERFANTDRTRVEYFY